MELNHVEFGKDYFDELLRRISEIRASERRFYQKVTDIYAQCSYDYDQNSEIKRVFFATVQNKFHYAITGYSAAELILKRADCDKDNMGLTCWINSPDNHRIKTTDVKIALNYYTVEEIKELESIVNMYLDYAERQAKLHNPMRMKDWADKLDDFLEFNDYEVLGRPGATRAAADNFAKVQLKKYKKKILALS